MTRFFGTADEIADMGYDIEELAKQIFSNRYGELHNIAEELKQIAERLDELSTDFAQISIEQEENSNE